MSEIFIHKSACVDADAIIGAGTRIWHWTYICSGAVIGENSSLGQNVFIADGVVIGAGAVIAKDVPDYALMVGNPAKQIGWVCVCGKKLANKLCCPACQKSFEKALNGLIGELIIVR